MNAIPEYAGPEEWRSLDVIFQQVEKQLTLQFETSDSHDRKLELLLAFIGVMLAAALGLGTRSFVTVGLAANLTIVSLALLIVSGLVSVLAYFPRKLSRPPEPEYFRINYLLQDERLTKRELADAMVVAYNRNQKIVGRKNFLLKGSLMTVAIGIALFGTALLIDLFN